MPAALYAKDAEAVQGVYRDYKELAYSRHGLNKLFALTLTMTLLFSLLSAVALAFVLSQRMSAPLGLLAEGTKAVAKGVVSTIDPDLLANRAVDNRKNFHCPALVFHLHIFPRACQRIKIFLLPATIHEKFVRQEDTQNIFRDDCLNQQ